MVRVGMVDRWLAERVQRLVAPVAVRLELWDGTSSFSASDPPVGDLVVRDRRTLLGLAVNPDLWFGETYAAGRLAIRGAAEPVVEALSRLSGPAATWRARLRALLAPAQFPPRRPPQRPPPLRSGERLLSALARSGPRLHLRVLRRPGDVARPGAARQARSRVPQAAAAARRHGGRGRVRLGSAGPSHGAPLRRDGEGVQRVARAAWLRPRAGRTRRADRSGRVHRRRLPQRAGRSTTCSCRWGCWSTSACVISTASRTSLHRTVRRQGGRGLLHFIGRDVPLPLNAWIRRRVFPGAYPPTLAEVTSRVLGPAGMSVVDVENLRLHYARTLEHWSGGFAAAADQIRGEVRRGLLPHVGAVPGGRPGRLCHRVDAAVPDCVHAARIATAVVDPRRAATNPRTWSDDSVRRTRRRRRSGGLDLCTNASPRRMGRRCRRSGQVPARQGLCGVAHARGVRDCSNSLRPTTATRA